MDALILNLQSASTPIQALAVSAGGLIGVFATLFTFFLIIFISDKVGKKGGD
jgi:hypothetical protein